MTQDVFLVVALGLLIFMMVFSNRKRKKQAEALQSNLVVGKAVMLHSGIIGNIVSIEDKNLVIETTKDVKITVVKGAVRSVEEAPLVFSAAKPAAKATAAKAPAAKTAAKTPAKKAAK